MLVNGAPTSTRGNSPHLPQTNDVAVVTRTESAQRTWRRRLHLFQPTADRETSHPRGFVRLQQLGNDLDASHARIKPQVISFPSQDHRESDICEH